MCASRGRGPGFKPLTHFFCVLHAKKGGGGGGPNGMSNCIHNTWRAPYPSTCSNLANICQIIMERFKRAKSKQKSWLQIVRTNEPSQNLSLNKMLFYVEPILYLSEAATELPHTYFTFRSVQSYVNIETIYVK